MVRGMEQFDYDELPTYRRSLELVKPESDFHLAEVLPAVTHAYDQLEELPEKQREKIEQSVEKIESVFSEWECVLNPQIKQVLIVIGLQDARNNRLVAGTLEHTAGLLDIALTHRSFIEQFLAQQKITIQTYLESLALHDSGKALIPDEIMFAVIKPGRKERKNSEEERQYREIFWEVVYPRMQENTEEAQHLKDFVRSHLVKHCRINVEENDLNNFLKQEYEFYMSDISDKDLGAYDKAGKPLNMRIRLEN